MASASSNRSTKITPGRRRPDSPQPVIKDSLMEIGDYCVSTTSNAIFVRPPLSTRNVKIRNRDNAPTLHQDGTISLALPVTITNTRGTWIGRLQRGFWVESTKINFVDNPLAPKLDIDALGEFLK